jgi:hypothetical protein
VEAANRQSSRAANAETGLACAKGQLADWFVGSAAEMVHVSGHN